MKQKPGTIARNSWYTFLTLLTILGFKFLINLIIARVLGATMQGTYYLLITFNTLAVRVTSLGVHTSSSVFLSKQKYDLPQINTACVILAVAFGLFFVGIYSVSAPIIHATLLKDVGMVYGWFVILMLPLGLYGVFWRGMMIGVEEIGGLNKIELGGVILQLSILVFFLVLGYGLIGALAAWGASLLLTAFLGWWMLARKSADNRWHSNFEVLREAVRFGVASQWGEIARMLVLRSDVFLLNLLTGPEMVGYYSVALSLTEKLWITYTSLYRAATRQLQALSKEQAARLLARITRGTTFLVSIAALCLAFISPWLLPILYGHEYMKSVIPFIVLLSSLVPYGVWAGVSIFITGQLYRPNLTSLIHWVALMLSVVIYYVLIRLFGIIGAAVGSTLSYSILCVLGVVVIHREVQLPIFDFFVVRKRELVEYRRLGLQRIMRIAGKV